MKNRNLQHKDDWETPQDFYDQLNQEFAFDFDPCPIHATFDGLAIPWGNSNFVNPPYSRKLKEAFIKKGLQESKLGKLVVLLLPVSTSTKVFHELILPNAVIRFVRGRLSFRGINTKGELVGEGSSPMHDSMIVIFSNRK